MDVTYTGPAVHEATATQFAGMVGWHVQEAAEAGACTVIKDGRTGRVRAVLVPVSLAPEQISAALALLASGSQNGAAVHAVSHA